MNHVRTPVEYSKEHNRIEDPDGFVVLDCYSMPTERALELVDVLNSYDDLVGALRHTLAYLTMGVHDHDEFMSLCSEMDAALATLPASRRNGERSWRPISLAG